MPVSPNPVTRESEFRTVGISPAMVLIDVYPGDVFEGPRDGPAGSPPKAFVWGVADDGRVLMSRMYQDASPPGRFALSPSRDGWRMVEPNDLARRKVARGV